MKVITTRLISKKLRVQQLTLNLRKSIKRQSTKVFQTDDQGLFDVYNLGTASTLRVKELILLEKQVLRKILPKLREKSSTEGSLFFVALHLRIIKIAIAILVENGGFGQQLLDLLPV
jgi:penicillin-binding protein 2